MLHGQTASVSDFIIWKIVPLMQSCMFLLLKSRQLLWRGYVSRRSSPWLFSDCSTLMTILHTHFHWCYPDNITGFGHLLDCISLHKELWLCRLIKIIITIKNKQAKDRLKSVSGTTHPIHRISLMRIIIDFSWTWFSLLPFHPPIWSHFFLWMWLLLQVLKHLRTLRNIVLE